MKRTIILLLLFSWLISDAQHQIIPAPVHYQAQAGEYNITRQTVISAADEQDRLTALILNSYLDEKYGLKLEIGSADRQNAIMLRTRKFIQPTGRDGYEMQIGRQGIVIEGESYAGTFYGMQTLIQMLPVFDLRSLTEGDNIRVSSLRLPFAVVTDTPRFRYRGMHLDVARHFFPVSYIKKYIDYLALHKMNYFHWHLTDDQGWRIEIQRYPALTQTGACRHGTIIGRFPGIGNDNTPYGGFYTQEEVREVIRYAAERHITVIPEIEMPGHSSAAIAAYPWLSCFPDEPTSIPVHPSGAGRALQSVGVNKLVQETWGVYEDVFCAGSDSTFAFLEGVLDEVLALFPSQFIHIGGDEVPKAYWKRCSKCQARMRREGLKNENELQSYFIRRMEKFLNSRQRIIIGWDEILEGGLAPNAVVMSWRGEKGGIDAARQKHFVIMTPQKPLYFDHSQTRNEDSLVIGGYNPIEEVYAYDPVPRELKGSGSGFVLGAQGNLWTEYIRYPEKIEYMIFPRMSALAEVLWTPPEKKDWKDFERRLQTQFRRYELWGANYSTAYFDVDMALGEAPGNRGVRMTLQPRDQEGQVFVSGIESRPVLYTQPLVISKSGIYTISYYRNGQLVTERAIPIHLNKATGKKVSINAKPNDRYPGQGGAFSLVNGIVADRGLSHPDWLGWIGNDLVATIDLGTLQTVDSVRMHTIDQNASWVYLPSYMEVLVSTDGKNYRAAGRTTKFVTDTLTSGWMTVHFSRRNARYIRVFVKNYGIIPQGLPGGGSRSWIFADEIQVY